MASVQAWRSCVRHSIWAGKIGAYCQQSTSLSRRSLHSSSPSLGVDHPNSLRQARARLIAFHQHQQRQATSSIETSSEVGDPAQEAIKDAEQEWRWIGEEVRATIRDRNDQAKQIVSMVDRLVQHEPLAYVLGHQPFGPLSIRCQAPTLIPRVETEALVEMLASRWLLPWIATEASNAHRGDRPLRILDLCCGSGCIALLLRHQILEARTSSQQGFPTVEIVGVDLAEEALRLSQTNDQHYIRDSSFGALHAQYGNRVKLSFVRADMLDDQQVNSLLAKSGPFDMVICNPPYISLTEWQGLEPGVMLWEDRAALIGHGDNEQDGLHYYRRLANLAQQQDVPLLTKQSTVIPSIAVEVGHRQAHDVSQIFQEAGADDVEIWKDQFDTPRAVLVHSWKTSHEGDSIR